MKDISDVVCCTVDNGLFLPFARRMAKAVKRSIFVPASWERGFVTVQDACIGAGFEDVEHRLDFWEIIKDIDLFCFPDIGHGPLQNYLTSIGKAVWGSRTGDIFEQNREFFMATLKRVGMEVPPFKVCVGIGELTQYLAEKENVYIKVSRWRGNLETRQWRSWEQDWPYLDWLANELGPFKHSMRFLVFDEIDTPLELGGDTYNIFGQWPSLMLNGFEFKDNTYFSSVTKRTDMPEQIQEIMEAFGPELERYGYCNQWSMEDRVKDDKHWFNDATCRGGMPSSASQYLAWKNWPEIVWAGANGELVEPDEFCKFTIECMVKSKGDSHGWDHCVLDPELEDHLMFSHACYVDGAFWFPPDDTHAGDLGWLTAVGNTPSETLDRSKALADLLPDGLDANVEAMANLIKEIDQAAEKGIPFTHQSLPKPVEAIN